MKNNTPLSSALARTLSALVVISAAAMLSSCAHINPPAPEPEPAVVEKKPPPKPIKPPPPSPLYEWWGKDYVSHIEVSIDEQMARFYTDDKMVGWTTVASGVHKFPTPTGKFAVTEKVQDKKSNLYGKIYNRKGKLVKRNAKMGVHSVPAGGSFKGAPMPYFMRLTNDGIGLHAGPIPRPGNRASHGCIRMPRNFAPILYRHVDIGTPVTIKGNGPTYASYVSKQRKSSPKPKATAVAKVDKPASAPTVTPPANTAPVPDTEQSVSAQAIASVPQQQDDAVSETGTSSPAAQQLAPAIAETPSAGAVRVTAEPQSSQTAEATPQNPGTAGASPTPAQTPATAISTTPSAPPPISTEAQPSMSGSPATPAPVTPAPPANQQATPVSSAPPPTITGPTAQAEG